MSKKMELRANPVIVRKPMDAGYMTQMLRELAIQAHERDVELAYFIEMAVVCSYELDAKEASANRRQAATA